MKIFYTAALSAALLSTFNSANGQISKLGQWDFVGLSGVSSMHAILSPGTNKALFIERVELATNVELNGKPTYNVEYDLDTNTIRPMTTLSNTFCSAGSYMSNGTVANLGGAEPKYNVTEGFDQIRLFTSCADGTCDWQKSSTTLLTNRWYPTVVMLSDGTLLVVGGAIKGCAVNSALVNVASLEFFPATTSKPIDFEFLVDTLPYNLYPITHLLPGGNLFVLANKKAIILDTKTWSISKNLPDIPGSPRSYPLTGGSLLLQLDPDNDYDAEVLVCGGSNSDSTDSAAEKSCGRIKPQSSDPTWEMEDMPYGRLMPDLIALADGNVLIINGCNKGIAGFNNGDDPTLTPVMYNPMASYGSRFTTLQPSYVPRMYHSVAFMIPSGQVLVSGSNPNKDPTGSGKYPTDFRVETFSPPYLFTGLPRPEISKAPGNIKYSQTFIVEYISYSESSNIVVKITNPGFVTHSTHMGQRMVLLSATGSNTLSVKVPTSDIAPPGPYLLFILDNGVPSNGVWVMLGT